ncbi:unnamed protein product, partial [Ilex paraguariensis]
AAGVALGASNEALGVGNKATGSRGDGGRNNVTQHPQRRKHRGKIVVDDDSSK